MIHFVYILKCADGDHYTGIAKDLKNDYKNIKKAKVVVRRQDCPLHLSGSVDLSQKQRLYDLRSI